MKRIELHYVDGLRPEFWDNVEFISFGCDLLVFYVLDKEDSVRIPLKDIHSFVIS